MDKTAITVVVLAIICVIYFVVLHWPRKPYAVISDRTNKVVKRFETTGEACLWISERYMTEGPHGPTYRLKRD
jgi:hypothetical protein